LEAKYSKKRQDERYAIYRQDTKNLINQATNNSIVGLVHLNCAGEVVEARHMQIVECACDCGNRFRIPDLNRIFEGFNRLPSHEAQNLYLQGNVECHGYEEMRNGQRRRIFRYKLTFPLESHYVCRRFFCGVHGISHTRIRRKVKLPKLLLFL